MPMTLEEFRATKRPCDDTTWKDLTSEGIVSGFDQEDALLYADGFLIHKASDKFMVHAWWYSPLGYDTLEEAEAKLYPWYLELV